MRFLKRSPYAKDTPSVIVRRPPWWVLTLGWSVLMLGVLFLALAPSLVLDSWRLSGDAIFMGLFGVFFLIPFGLFFARMYTKITFDTPPEHITVQRGHIPIFFLKRQVILSRDQARTAYLGRLVVSEHYVGTFSDVLVMIDTDKSLKLHRDRDRDVAAYLARRIREFGGVAY